MDDLRVWALSQLEAYMKRHTPVAKLRASLAADRRASKKELGKVKRRLSGQLAASTRAIHKKQAEDQAASAKKRADIEAEFERRRWEFLSILSKPQLDPPVGEHVGRLDNPL